VLSHDRLSLVTLTARVVHQNALITRKAQQIEQGEHRDEARYLTRAEVARLFGVSPSTVTRWARKRLLKVVRTPGGHYRFPARETLEAVAALTDAVAGERR
jgi:excisionase family DNA binding protein